MKTPTNLSRSKRIAAVASVLLVLAAAALYLALRQRPDTPDTSAEGAAAAVAANASGKTGLAAADLDGDGIVYRSGMHPWIVKDEPGVCPICGMDLVPTPVGAVEEGVVSIDPVMIQNIGVRTAPVTVTGLGRSVRTTGRFEANERAQAAVSPKISGWVEKLHVDYDGARVRRGQPLLEIYSPELVSTQEEYLLALNNARRLAGTPAEADAKRLVEAARRRLGYWDISEAQIRRLEETGEPQKTLTLYAPASGTVTRKDVVEGQQVMAGQTLIELADLSRLWLMVDVYEQDLAWAGIGTRATIELPYEPGATLNGRVEYVYDAVNPETRTAQARISVPNPGLKFKPGMYATVVLHGGDSAPLPTIPEEALIRTGERELVVLALGNGRFMPREVTAGIASGGRVQILDGLSGGEQVVTSAQFLIDSEAKLKSAVGAMAAGHDHGGTAAVQETPPGRQVQMQNGVQVVRVTVGASGFDPERLQLKPGVPARLVFTRTDEVACAEEVQVPAFGIANVALPLDTAVPVEFTPRDTGTFTFACGMDMVKGAIVVAS